MLDTKDDLKIEAAKSRLDAAFRTLLWERRDAHISVRDICLRANAPLSAFYEYYTDINDFIGKLTMAVYTQLLESFSDNKAEWLSGGFLYLFRYIKAHRSLFWEYMQCCKIQNIPCSILPAIVLRNLETLIRNVGFGSDQELYYHQTFFCEGLNAVIKLWISRDCNEAPEEMCRLVEREYSAGQTIFRHGIGRS